MNDKIFLEKIREIVSTQLEPIKTTQAEHSEMLKSFTIILADHSSILAKQSAILEKHSKLFAKQSRILSKHTKELKELKKLASNTANDVDVLIRQFDQRIGENSRDIAHIKDHLRIN